ncbi:hypothetical protein EL26_12250 [Tumebacillus flagellatus]|uniref:DUF2140 domain-containing protein n=1 Tax=Tumebacillus flagellatus TaxID=1157490 RepID=A0A074LT59_9BACL|nr:hypothetical protein EL26_12250 [Tumebacillus flagellatus]
MLTALVLAVLAAAMYFWFSITSPGVSESKGLTNGPPPAGGIPIQATVPLASINQFVDRQLQQKETPLQGVQLGFDQKLLRVDSKLTFFGRVMDIRIWMKPEVQPNGDVRLVAEESKIGDWSIPLKTLFGVLEGMPWPQWVHIQPEQHLLDVKLSEKSGGGPVYRVKNIDTSGGKIQMEILLD